MFILDTNVISELRRTNSGAAHPAVVNWSDAHDPGHIFLSAVTIFEIEMGLLKIAPRNDANYLALRAWFSNKILAGFADKILPIDANVALIFARIMSPRTRPYRDALIAATAQHYDYTVVTRNIRGFADLPIRVVDPWDFT